MPELLKDYFTDEWISNLGNALGETDPTINPQAFFKAVKNKDWENMELKARTQHITRQMEHFLPGDYKHQINLLSKIANRFTGLTALVFPTFVEFYGMDDETTSLTALKLFTQYSTAEFAIRPFILNNPQIMKTLYTWSKDENYHVRRLASEGCRPLLPWGQRLSNFVNDPSPIFPILETLVNDPEDYVYRSVANNLNDISKNQPEAVLAFCKKHLNTSPTTRWVAKHALRTLLKQGNTQAMRLFGFASAKAIQVSHLSLAQSTFNIGDETFLEIHLKNNGVTGKFRFEYVIGYLKKNGTHSEKVFQLKETTLDQGQELKLRKKVSFQDRTVRKHYAGAHYLTLKANGELKAKIDFSLIAV